MSRRQQASYNTSNLGVQGLKGVSDMRFRVDGTALIVDLLHKQSDVLQVVRLCLALGIADLRIRYIDKDKGTEVVIIPAESFAEETLPALLTIVAKLRNRSVVDLVNHWLNEHSHILEIQGDTSTS